MKALDFHSSVLSSVGVYDLAGDGYLTAVVGDNKIPVSVNKKRLVLPNQDILKLSPWDTCIGYNPFAEKLTRGESPVLKFTKDAITLRLNDLFGVVLKHMLTIAADPALQKRVGPKVADLLKACPEANEKTIAKLDRLIDAVRRQPQHNFIAMYLKHGGENGASRTCVVSFPVLEELNNEEATEIFGVKFTSAKDKDKGRIKGLIEQALGELESYTYGSDSPEAPYFHALLTSYYKVASQINGLLTKYKKVIEGADELKIDLSWVEGLDEFHKFRGQIPSLEGNEGVVLDKDGKPDEELAAARMLQRDQVVEEAPRSRRRVGDEEDEQPRRRERDRDERTRGRDRDDDNDPMAQFRAQFRRDEEPSRSSSWGRGGRREERDSWGRPLDRDDDDRRGGRGWGSRYDDRGSRSRRRYR